MKKILSLLLTLCLLLGVLPSQALAYVGDIISPGSTNVQTSTNNNSLVLQNDYIRVTLNRQTGILTTAPTAASDSPGQQKPYCEFITYDNGIGYNKKEITHPATLSLKSASFMEKTPNGDTKAIKAEYALTFELSGKSVSATTAVYYELVQCGENKSSADAWGVLTSVDNIKINANSFGDLNLATDMSAWWGYTLDGFSGMGHANATDGPAIKMSRTVVKNEAEEEISTESSVITSKVDDLDTWQSFSQGTDWCYNYITEVYVDGYAWANPFVGLSGYYKNKTIKAYLPDTVSVTPGNNPSSTRVECRNDIGYYFSGDESYPNSGRFLWGFRNLTKNAADVPSEPDKVEVSINAKRLAAFADGNDGVTVEYVADDAALNALKQRYGNPVALISGDYESKNGTDFAFTGGAALLSPSVTATWGNGGELVIHKDGTITHSGLSLNAPSFKFYQPNSGAGEELKIKLTQDGFLFEIDPEKNDAVIYVDIPYATAKLEKVTADAAGNLVFAGGISFQTVFEGASFTLKELGYGLNDKNEFTVNGVHATGSFDTAKTLSLELAKVEGEVNTFKGKEKYAFTLELNAFDLFETEAELELVRSKKDGSLLPNTLYFFVSASPGIPLIPPVPIGQLNGGGAGFKDLAATVNGDYFAIPPLKLRGTLKGTYLHLIEGKGDVVIGPSEISLKANDVGIVGTNASIIDSFGYSLQLNGQERTYHGTTYKGIYFVGSETLELDLPSTEIDVFILDTSIELGAFGGTGTKNDTKHLYLGVGANAVVKSKVQVPSDVPVIGGWKLSSWDVDLIVGGQTEFPIEGVSVSEGMEDAFDNIDVYLGAMTGVYAGIIDARLWVLVPNIVETNFRRGGGWDVETKWFGRLPEWDWSEKGVEPVAQAMSLEDSEDTVLMSSPSPTEQAASLEAVGESTPTSNTNSTEQTAPMEDAGESVPANSTNSTEQAASSEDTGESAPANSTNSTEITVSADTDETPYILLAFENTVTEEQIKNSLSVTKQNSSDKLEIHWVNYDTENSEDGQINENKDINATTDIIHNKTDNKDYRVAILRLKDAGTYQVNTGSLSLDTQKSQGVSIAPFEELALSLNSNQVSGEIKYAEENTKYVLRTYFANEEGGADYLIDEQEVTDASKISVTIPQSGALAPSGEYYVTSFLMTEKSVESIDENGEKETLTGLVAIDHQQFNTQVNYQNQNQPTAPQTVTLELAGNEVMTAKWDKVDDAAGYAVTIYQKNGGKWIDTGFGYDLDKETTSINMALTVGGEETTKSKNLSANEAYKVGVRAYKEDAENEGGKYYSAETESADEGVYQTLAKAFQNAWDGSTITLMRDVNLNGSCSASDTITLDLHGKTITSGDKFFNVNEKLTVKDSSESGGRQALNVKFLVASSGTLAVDDSYTGDISCVELWAGGALEAYTGTIQELLLGKGNGTGYSVKLWKDNAHCCTVKTITLAENADQNLTVGGLLETNHAKCELYGEKDGTWSIVDKSTKIVGLTGYTAYKVQFAECVHQCDNDTVEKPVCSKCGKVLVVKITATASDGKTRTAWFPADSGIENGDGYVEAIQTLNGWSAEGYTDATLMPLCDAHDGTTGGIGIANVTLTGKLAVDGGEHLINSTTIAAGADVTFKTGQFRHITINGKASFVGGTYLGMVTASSGAEAVFSGGAYQYLKVEDGGTAVVKDSAAFGEDVTVTKGTLTVEGGSFRAAVVVEGDGTMNVNGGSFTGTGKLDRVKYSGGAKGTVSGGSFADLYLYSSGTAWLAGGSFTKLSTADSGVLSSLLADGAAYYDQSGNAISGSGVSELNNVTVKTHTHTVDEQTGICSVCQKQMAASLTAGNETSWYLTLDAAIKAVNEGNGEKTLKLYQDVKTDAPSYELTHGPVTLDVNGKKASGLIITIKGIQLTVTGTGTIRDVTASGSSAVVKNSTVKINYITAENGGRLELGGGSYMGLTVKNDGSSASLSGGTYNKIEWGQSYVPANEYLADGYGYKTSEGAWDDGTGSVVNVTVTPAPIKSTKVYPNSETDYSGSTFDAKDSTSVTLTVSFTPEESAGLTYIWCRSINDEWRWLTNPYITQDLTEKYTGADSQTLSITELPAGQTFSYKVQIETSDGYKCYSEPFTVSTCAHDGDKTLQRDETHHWYVCGKCGAELGRAEHSGGTATCTAKAVCSTCQTAYGELGGHTLTKHDAVDATCTAPGNVEYWHCSVCGKNFSDSAGTGELTEITSPALNHNWGVWTSNDNGTHTRTCQRDSRHTETENCSGGSATCTNAAICTICGGSYGKELGHDWGEWKNTDNAQQHTRTCQRDQSHTETAAHTPGTPANCTTPQTCTACGYEITPANNNHDWNAWESNENGTHTHTCKNDSSHTETTNCSGGSATCEAQAVCDVCHMVYGELAPHTLTHTPAVDATCTTPGNVEYWHCSVCGKNFSDSEGKGELTEVATPALNHTWGEWEKVSETQHQRICQNDGSHKETGDHTPGTAATCKAPANCSICGQPYGEKNPSNHTGGTEVRNQKEATTTTEGYTGDTYCLGCGEKIASGTVIPKLPSSGGGSSSGGGGGSSTPSVTIPVSSDHGGAKLSATISGSTATVSVSGKEIDKVIADGAKSVTVDLSRLSKVDSVKLPASIIAKTEDAEDTRLTIRLPDGAVELDEAALESIASGKTVTVSVQQAKLTNAQQEAVNSLAQVAVVVDVDIVVGTVKQSAFNGGRLTISIPYIPEKGEDTSTLAVWYIRDDGSIENKGGSYDAKSGCFVFETDHLSRYLLVHTEQVMGFTDVSANSWYAGAVAWAVEQGITSGTSDTTFSPNVSCTRAQMVTFLWRASGTPEIGTTSPFSDVSADAYYYDAVLWAVEQGITGGTGDGKFSPDAPCTRAQMATFLWRANGSPKVTGTTPFSDVSAGTYYCNAVLWAYEQNITNGTGGGKFSPDAPCTRAQMVQMLKNASDAA